jgi:hypothetical protein
MLVDQRVVGVIVSAHPVDPFDERSIGLVTTFAARVIAIQNVRRGLR